MPSPAKPTAKFDTITGDDWRRSIQLGRSVPNYFALKIIAQVYFFRMKPTNTRAALILEVAHLVFEEMKRQDDKFGPARVQSHFKWNAILTEEVGEAAQEALALDSPTTRYYTEDIATLQRLETEIVQVAAVATQWAAAVREERLKLQLEQRARS